MIRLGTIKPGIDAFRTLILGRLEALQGARRMVISPSPNGRSGSDATNGQVIGYLASANPVLLDLRGADLDRAAREAARRAWRPRTSTLASLALAAGPAVARALAARLRSGRYVTNTPETTRRKGGLPGGVDTGQLAASIDNATVTVE